MASLSSTGEQFKQCIYLPAFHPSRPPDYNKSTENTMSHDDDDDDDYEVFWINSLTIISLGLYVALSTFRLRKTEAYREHNIPCTESF